MIGIINVAISGVFSPLIAMGPVYTIAGISLLVSFVFSIMYKILVDQKKIKFIRREMKSVQEKINNARKKGDENKMRELWTKSMGLNNEQMMMNMKPMIVSMVFVMLILPWLAGMYGDISSSVENNSGMLSFDGVEQQFSVVEDNDNWVIMLDSGELLHNGETIDINDKTLTVSIPDDYEKDNIVKFKKFRVKLPFSLPYFGSVLGWLGYYIIISMPATYLFRKMLGVE